MSLILRHTRATSSNGPRMLEVGGEGTEGVEGEQGQGYTDVSVREAVEWTMGKDSEFTYVDVRSAEEHEKLATAVRCACVSTGLGIHG